MIDERHPLALAIEGVSRKLSELEDAARKLSNQNFADLIKGARGRLAQAVQHPDLIAVAEVLHGPRDRDQERLPFDGKDGEPFPGMHTSTGA